MKIGYARVSTFEQNLDMQIDALEKAGCELIFKEKISSTKSERPERKKLMSQLRKGDTLIIWKLDRYARSIIELTKLAKDLEEKGVNLKSLNDPIDTSTAAGRFLYNMLAAVAQLERDNIVERTKAGLAAARARGRFGGRPKGLSKENKAKAKMAASLYKAQDLSVSEILENLNLCKATFYKYLRHEGIEPGSQFSTGKLTTKEK